MKIVFIAPGPTYDPASSSYQNRFTLLSEKMSGFILTTSNKKIKLDIGRFKFLAFPRSNKKMLGNLKFLWYCVAFAFRTKKRGGDIDCIVTYDPLKTGLIGCLLKLVLKVKLIVEVNGVYMSPAVWMDDSDGWITSFKRIIIPHIMAFVLRNADGIKLQFPNQINEFRKNVKGKVVRSYPNLTPINRFDNLGEQKEILLIGFPFKLKGVDVLIKAFKELSPKYPDWKLKILGWYPDPKQLFEAIGGHPQIYHHPPVPYKEMVQHIGKSGIVVQPSRSDALPRALVEAAAAGKPRIGSNVDGIPIAVEDGVDGFLVEPGNIKDLVEKLELLMRDKALRARLGKAAGIKAIKVFSTRRYLENTYRLYLQVANK